MIEINDNRVDNQTTISSVEQSQIHVQSKRIKKKLPWKYMLLACLLLVMAAGAVVGGIYIAKVKNDTRSKASTSFVDLEVSNAYLSFPTNSTADIPIKVYPNQFKVSGIELVITVSDPTLMTIADVTTLINGAQVVSKQINSNQAKVVFASNCSNSGCTPIATASILAMVKVNTLGAAGSLNMQLTGSRAAVVGQPGNMIGDAVGRTFTVFTSASPRPSSSPTVKPSPTPKTRRK